MNKIIENIENNIHGRHEADKVMLALEIITRMPNTFLKLVNAGSFFGDNHYHDNCTEDNDSRNCCDNCYSGDTEFENNSDLRIAAQTLFKHMVKLVDDDAEESDDETEETEEKHEQLNKRKPMGLRKPILLSENMIGFIREADFGTGLPGFNLFFKASENGISNLMLMTFLLSIYSRKHMQIFDDKKFIKSTPLTDKYFGDTFKQLNINPDKFMFSWFPRIISLNKENNLTDKQLDLMYSHITLNRLDNELKILKIKNPKKR